MPAPLHAIAAMAENRAIGLGNRLPWHLPEDFRWFKQKTLGGTLVMGRKTFESLGGPLPGRATVVLSRTGAAFPGAETVADVAELLRRELKPPVYVAGGEEIYRLLLPHCEDLFLTRVKGTYEGDTFFPPFEHLFPHRETLRETSDFVIERYFQ